MTNAELSSDRPQLSKAYPAPHVALSDSPEIRPLAREIKNVSPVRTPYPA